MEGAAHDADGAVVYHISPPTSFEDVLPRRPGAAALRRHGIR